MKQFIYMAIPASAIIALSVIIDIALNYIIALRVRLISGEIASRVWEVMALLHISGGYSVSWPWITSLSIQFGLPAGIIAVILTILHARMDETRAFPCRNAVIAARQLILAIVVPLPLTVVVVGAAGVFLPLWDSIANAGHSSYGSAVLMYTVIYGAPYATLSLMACYIQELMGRRHLSLAR